ncbi:ATP synthase subunit I [Synechococcus sp. PCC 7336]|uniref:ATP synthase subunit I n=1 Tax=Synechococcus sp. PCC 7336 TaxID=195250 RepID=UPI00034B5E93|nr:ATP synthase subunit I [Synechococcus sp. PCC 7336]
MSHSESIEAEPELISADASSTESPSETAPPLDRMQAGGEYSQLTQQLLVTTLACSIVIALSIAWIYPFNIVANYGLGAVFGLVYFRMLAKGVARLGPSNRRLGGPNRLVLFAALIVVATRVESLEVLPIFFGFMTYKAALFVYAIQTLVPSRKSDIP